MDKHVNFYFQSLLSTIIYVFDILFNLPESRKLRKILPGFSTSRGVYVRGQMHPGASSRPQSFWMSTTRDEHFLFRNATLAKQHKRF